MLCSDRISFGYFLYYMGVWLSWESACFACRRPGVRIPSSPPDRNGLLDDFEKSSNRPFCFVFSRSSVVFLCFSMVFCVGAMSFLHHTPTPHPTPFLFPEASFLHQRFFTASARMAFKTARIITPTSAKTASHMFANPRAMSTRQSSLMPMATAMF